MSTSFDPDVLVQRRVPSAYMSPRSAIAVIPLRPFAVFTPIYMRNAPDC